eukprot:TRINITY_DN865_c3_g1_i1.p1 TRINITY_DN865_c3_g1~~TRINITY_DN865_c3_g1_i1.p1  ORF type:complete len:728 (+),score=208.85 TRINITY_DN865_c3_g1_i1:36-2219(+)
MAEDQRKLERLQRHFGGGRVDKDILLSVLAVCEGDVDAAIRFLTAGEGDVIEDPNRAPNEETIPRDYPGQQASGRKLPGAKPDTDDFPQEKREHIARIKKLFANESLFKEHYSTLKESEAEYICCMVLLLHQGVEFSKSSRPRILASCWALKKYALATYLLQHHQANFYVPEVVRAVQLLDAPRKIKALEKKIEKLTRPTVTNKKVNQMKAQVQELNRELIEGTSVSGSLSKKIRSWIKTIPAEELNFFALQMPKEPWQELSDVIHLHPSDFQCDWFLDVSFGKSPPEGSLLKLCNDQLNSNNVIQILKDGHQIPYSYLRSHIRPIPEEAKPFIAKYAKIDTLIWYHEELQSDTVNTIIAQRLASGETPQFTYGKLVERLLYLKRNKVPFYNLLVPVAEERLHQIKLLLEPPVVVLGDASFSMDVAIRTATIISSILTVLTNAELKFFNTQSVDPPCTPTTIKEVIEVAENVKPNGQTVSASSIWPYYLSKKKVKFFVVVTDEIENGKFNNSHYFPDLFAKYYQEVYPAKIVFVSFLDNPNVKGRMVKSLENLGIDVLQFRLDGKRPDLTKMDTLLGLLGSESSFFPKGVVDLANFYEKSKTIITNSSSPKVNVSTDDSALESLLQELKNPLSKPKEFKDVEEKNRADPIHHDFPEHFCCPITSSIMKDPVMTPSGHTYERETILVHLSRNQTDPLTNEPLTMNDLIPNRALKNAISDYCEKHNIVL